MVPIVLLHGFPLDASMWEKQAAFLRGRGHTVITPDLPGFGGRAALPEGRASMEAFAEVIGETIQREAGGRAIVGGFSMGGYVLLALLREDPGMVAGAMLIDTRAEADSAEGAVARWKSIEEVERNGTGGLIEGLLGKLLGKRPAAGVRERAREIMQRQSAAGVMEAQRAMAQRRDQTELLPGLKMPILIVVGAEDTLTPPSVALAMQAHIPHAMVAQIASAGHLAPLEQAEAVNQAMEMFLATIGRGSQAGV